MNLRKLSDLELHERARGLAQKARRAAEGIEAVYREMKRRERKEEAARGLDLCWCQKILLGSDDRIVVKGAEHTRRACGKAG